MNELLIAFALGLVLTVCVAVDARGRRWPSSSSVTTWTVLTFLFGFFALPFYLVARSRTQPALRKRTPAPPSYTDVMMTSPERIAVAPHRPNSVPPPSPSRGRS